MRVLHLAPSGNKCGIATYTNNLVGNFGPQSTHDRWTIPSPTELSRLTKPEVNDLFNESTSDIYSDFSFDFEYKLDNLSDLEGFNEKNYKHSSGSTASTCYLN